MNRLLLLAVLYAISVPASAIYKCKTGTQITYSDTECTNGTAIKTDDTFSAQDAKDARQRLATDKAELNRLTRERNKNEAIEERAQKKFASAAATKRKQCAGLEQHRQWAEEDAANAPMKSIENAKRKARRAAEKYTLACGK
ncbi:MAG: hypothetical protein HHJ12_13395 [Glaciimonas sp.]|nr:hypothetical protein [Glaciimonas sp.]